MDERPKRRRSIRLKGYDYSESGAYFVTICTRNRECLFGEILDGRMVLSEYGEIAREEWLHSEQIRREIKLDEFVVMPNHIHGIIFFIGDSIQVGATGRSPLQTSRPHGPLKKSLGSFVAGYKSLTTRRIIQLERGITISIWQRNYYEHVIRNEIDLEEIREYVENNPAKWSDDENHPANINRMIRHRRGDRLVAPPSDRPET
jgi:REP element-mobilizing transposase RayT